jgi:hypothetical protein
MTTICSCSGFSLTFICGSAKVKPQVYDLAASDNVTWITVDPDSPNAFIVF